MCEEIISRQHGNKFLIGLRQNKGRYGFIEEGEEHKAEWRMISEHAICVRPERLHFLERPKKQNHNIM